MKLDRKIIMISMTSLLLAGSLQWQVAWAGSGEGGQGGREVRQESQERSWEDRVREYNERLRWYEQRIADLTYLIGRYRQHENDPDLDEKQRQHAGERRRALERERARLEMGMSGLVP